LKKFRLEKISKNDKIKIMKENLTKVLKILPTDYEEYGGKVKRWQMADKDYPDCSYGCKYFVPIDSDWGVCSNPKSPRAGLLTWEHQAGFECFESKKDD
jgi:hypothetical protein